jgi:hypothetical protein
VAVFLAFVIIAAVIVLARPHNNTATSVPLFAGAHVAVFQK